jgi:excisionase family DNA binding protein
MATNIRLRRICQQCGKDFEAKTTVTAYCGDRCAKAAYKARKRAEKIEASNEQTRKVIERPMEEIRVKEFLNMADAGKLLGVSRWTLWRHIKTGTLNAVKLGSRTLIRRSDIDRLFDPGPRPVLPPEPTIPVEVADCYTLKEVSEKYGLSDKTLYTLIRRNEIPQIQRGWYVYVQKAPIDALLGQPQ